MPRTAKGKNAKPATQSNGNGIAALTAQFWQAAVNLRGSIEPADNVAASLRVTTKSTTVG
jgi:hypothetical protein